MSTSLLLSILAFITFLPLCLLAVWFDQQRAVPYHDTSEED